MMGSILRPWRLSIAVIGTCFLLASLLDTLPALIVKQLVDQLSAGKGDNLLAIAVLYFGVRFAVPCVNGFGIYRVSVVAQGALHALRVRLFAHLQQLPISYYDQTPIGDIISRGTADVETVDTLFSSGVAILVSFLLSLLTTSAAMLYLSAPLSLVAALIVPALVTITQFFRVRVRAAERATRVATGATNTHLQETLSGIEVIRSFQREPVFIVRFRRALHQMVQAENRSTLFNSLYPPLMAMLSAVLVAGLLWLGISDTLAAWGISLGTLTAFVLLFRGFFQVLIDLGDQWQTVQGALSGLERIVQVLNIPAEALSDVQRPT
ncbi:MAG: ABC transporter ATP-binding protein, partial [Chloroflexi bacterium]|nr:ABC transporter ATP-binding protein [Chloroflexota bacterium]